MRLEVHEIRGIGQEVLDLDRPVTIVRRDNAAGKTTLAIAAAACLGRDADPLALGVRAATHYVRAGAESKAATSTLTGPGWEVTWHAGRGAFTVEGHPPELPAMAARVGKSLVAGNRQQAGGDWLYALDAQPLQTQEIFDALWQHLEFVPDARAWVDRIAAALTGADDAAWQREYDYAQDRQQTAKRNWQDIVARSGEHEIYGVAKAAPWTPSGWSPQLEGLGAEPARRAVTFAETELTRLRDVLAAAKNVDEKIAFFNKQVDDQEAKIARARDEMPSDAVSEDFGKFLAAVKEAEDVLALAESNEGEAAKKRDEAEAAEQAAVEQVREFDATRRRNNERDEAEEKVTRLEITLKRVTKELEAARAVTEEACPTCGQDVSQLADFQTRRATRIVNLEEVEVAAKLDFHEAVEERAALDDIEMLPNENVDLENFRVATRHARADVDQCQQARKVSQKKLRDARIAFERAEAGPREIEQRRTTLAAQIEAAESQQHEARKHIVALNAGRGDVKAAQTAVDLAVTAVDTARHNAELIAIRDQAQRAHEDVVAWMAVASELSPATGLRARRIEGAIDEINAICSRIGSRCGFGDIAISRSKAGHISLQLDNRPVAALSGSEQWIVEAAVRAAICVRHNCPLVILDGVDILQQQRRSQFYKQMERLAETADLKIMITETV